jgi:biopolymer transport protein ExbD
MAVHPKKSGALQAVSLTPLIDVVFLLLIFFLVASRIADEEPQLDLDLPDISAALPATFQPSELIININSEGQYFVEGQFRPFEDVRSIVQKAHTNNPLTQTVVIRADRRVDWERVAEAIGLCRETGIQQYSATMDDGA